MNTRECPVCDQVFDECWHEGDFTVTFVGDIFSLTTALFATSHDQAERMANENLIHEYGWDVAAVSIEVSVVLEGALND